MQANMREEKAKHAAVNKAKSMPQPDPIPMLIQDAKKFWINFLR